MARPLAASVLLAAAVLAIAIPAAGAAALLPGDPLPPGADACVPTLGGGAFCFDTAAVAFLLLPGNPFTDYMWRPESVQVRRRRPAGRVPGPGAAGARRAALPPVCTAQVRGARPARLFPTTTATATAPPPFYENSFS